MPFKDPTRKAAYNASYNKKKREEQLIKEKNAVEHPFQLETVHSLTEVLEQVIQEVMLAKMRPEKRATCISSLVMASIKTLELSSISERLDRLEAKMLPAGVVMR